MKILQIINELRPAGAERIVLELSLGLLEKGHQTAVISLFPLPEKSNIIDELRKYQIPVLSLGVTKWRIWKMFGLARHIKNLKPDIVHAHLFHANLASRLASLRRDYKLVNTVHANDRRNGRFWVFGLDRITLTLCDSQTAVSYAVRDFHSRKLGVSGQTMPVIYNGIPPPPALTSKEREELRNQWKVGRCQKIIGSVGRLHSQKGYDRLIKLLPILQSYIPEGEKWGVVILGEGEERSRLESLCRQCPDNIVVRLPGFRKDAAQCIGAFDLFVMPSRYEGFGLTLVEAMAHGVPVLANHIDSLPELLAVYPNGRTINFYDADEKKIAQTIAAMALQQSADGQAPFTVTKMVNGYCELYEQLLSLKKAAG